MAIQLKANTGQVNLTSGAVIRGIDGGYYIPNVDAEGNLTWVPIKEGMVEAPGANIKGVQGDSGVYIGTTPGETDLVWIDPTDGEVTGIITPDEVQEMINKATIKPDLAGYATEDYVNNIVNNLEIPEEVDLSGYALKTDIPTLEGYALKTDIPTLEDYATKDYVAEEIVKAQLSGGEGEPIDLSAYALKTEIPTKTSQLTNDSGFLTAHQDLSDYALKKDIPSTIGLATEKYVDDAISDIEIPEAPDLSKYALKSEIPTNYITIGDVEAKGYLTEDEVKALISTELGVIENGTY